MRGSPPALDVALGLKASLGLPKPPHLRNPKRAKELALINGRQQVLDSDFEQAKRELTREEHLTPEPTAAEKLPEESRWEPVGESVAKEGPKVPAPDEQTFAERLVEEGVEDAEHDQMTRATRQSLRRDHDSET